MSDLESSDFYSELEAGLEAAFEAGKIMDRYRKHEIEIAERKNGLNDIVTKADLEIQETIVEKLKERFPEDGFLGEEEHLTPDGEERVWVIDPIDGTTNFQSGWTYFCASIALRVDGEYKVGVIHSPSSGLNKTWVALKGEGSFRVDRNLENREKLEVSARNSIEGGFFTCFQSPDNDERRLIEQKLVENLTGREMNYREVASGALALPEIAEGGLDARFDIVDEWDYAAASLILREAGGTFEKLGKQFGKDVVVSTNGKLHQEFLEAVRRVLDD